ncbi:MAG: hypothetical protein RI996_83 [Candidatus Parcubacteria bacterium]|jgi:hypothetical protein
MEIIISLLALIVSISAIYYSRKSAQSNLLIQFIEKESQYISDWNNSTKKLEKEDMMLKYFNLMETISLMYNECEISRKVTRKYFVNIFRDVYNKRKIKIEERIKAGDFEELNKVLNIWEIKKPL